MKTTLVSKNRIYPSLGQSAFLLIPLALACFALSPQARAVCQEGCDTVNFNTFLGDDALVNNTTGFGNTAIGSIALPSNTTGTFNTASGFHALLNNTAGNNNIALGASAGLNLSTGDDNIDIGNAGFAGESSKIRIGTEGTHTATYIAGITGAPLTHGAAVAVGIS